MALPRTLARLAALSLLVAVGASSEAGCSSASPGPSASWARICALISGCGEDFGVGSTCGEVASLQDSAGSGTNVMLACVAATTTCAEVVACISPTPAEVDACAGKNAWKCLGDVLVNCNVSGSPTTYDCAQDGQHCFQGASSAACGTGVCDPSVSSSSSCQGDVFVRCDDIGTAAEPGGVLTPIDCSKQWGWDLNPQYGDNCADSADACTSLFANTCRTVGGVAQCAGSGPACESNYVASCSGTVLSSCTGGQVAHFDCASLGAFTCKTEDYPDCEPNGPVCPIGPSESCADGVVTFCLGASPATLDCKSYGFSGCATTPHPGYGTLAKCTP